MDNNINNLRKEIIRKRKELPAEERLRRSDVICEKILATDEYRNADIVLVYADANGEVATDRLINKALLDGKKVYAPVSLPECKLEFYRVFALDEMEPGAYGIREPLKIEYLKLKSEDITDKTLCITPGVIFDKSGNRAGYGKGFYDRFFAENDISHRIGPAYDFQVTDAIDAKEHDIPVTKVITDD